MAWNNEFPETLLKRRDSWDAINIYRAPMMFDWPAIFPPLGPQAGRDWRRKKRINPKREKQTAAKRARKITRRNRP